jgi:hypothetical protein
MKKAGPRGPAFSFFCQQADRTRRRPSSFKLYLEDVQV